MADPSLFDAVKEQPVRPTWFFAFAPNTESWHGANVSAPQFTGAPELRRNFLGFVTSKNFNFHHFHRRDTLDVLAGPPVAS